MISKVFKTNLLYIASKGAVMIQLDKYLIELSKMQVIQLKQELLQLSGKKNIFNICTYYNISEKDCYELYKHKVLQNSMEAE